ncbi:MAG: ChaN family lipoprotein [Oligoflexus sp.]|nr:ChaN family lipoprotein [Oligoflexus sp.]
MKSLLKIAPLLLLLSATACVSDPKSHFALRDLDTKQQQDYASANIFLLGEQHDNPLHHQIQQEIIDKLGRDGRLRAVVFEQIDWTEQGVLSVLNPDNVKKLPKKIEWDKSGWPDYELYRPLIETAVKYKARVIAGGLPKNRLPLLYSNGYEGAFTATEIERLHVRSILDAEGAELLQKEIYESHCKMIPEDHVLKMVPVQRARDAALIRGYQNEAPIDGVTVFILGAGHARKEFGVPTLLKLAAPKTKIWAVGMQEEGSEPFPPGAFDKVWVTEKFEHPDHCADMKKHMDEKEKHDNPAPTANPKEMAPPAPALDVKSDEESKEDIGTPEPEAKEENTEPEAPADGK